MVCVRGSVVTRPCDSKVITGAFEDGSGAASARAASFAANMSSCAIVGAALGLDAYAVNVAAAMPSGDVSVTPSGSGQNCGSSTGFVVSAH